MSKFLEFFCQCFSVLLIVNCVSAARVSQSWLVCTYFHYHKNVQELGKLSSHTLG